MGIKNTAVEIVPKPASLRTVYLQTISCDKTDCDFKWTDEYAAYDAGVEIPGDVSSDPSDKPTEYIFYEAPDDCVHSEYRRFYCTEHARPVWEAVCAAIGADPSEEGRIDDDD